MNPLRRFARELAGDFYVRPRKVEDIRWNLDWAAQQLEEGQAIFGRCWCDDDDPSCPVTTEVHQAAERHGLTVAVDPTTREWELRLPSPDPPDGQMPGEQERPQDQERCAEDHGLVAGSRV
jgi:hypothetical protein